MLYDEILQYVKNEYGTEGEHTFRKYPEIIVLRHDDNRKWYGVIMYVKRSVLGMKRTEEMLFDVDGTQEMSSGIDREKEISSDMGSEEDEYVDILDVKADPMMIDMLADQEGYSYGYHMNKQHWLTILLDGSVDLNHILDLLDASYEMTASKKKKSQIKRLTPKNWLIPANPKHYDVIAAFEHEEVIDWKQSSDIRPGDIVYMYVAAPYSSVMFKCKAVETNLPYMGHHESLRIRKIMRIQLLDKYEAGIFTFKKLKEFGVYAVRGPRYMPDNLIEEIERYSSSDE